MTPETTGTALSATPNPRWPTGALTVLGVVIAALAAVAGYQFLWASTAYVAEARLAMRGGNRQPATQDWIASAHSGDGDLELVRQFVRSPAALARVGGRFDLRGAYAAPAIDWYQRLPADATDAALLERVRAMVELTVEPAPEVAVLRVRAFSATAAEHVAAALVDLARGFVERVAAERRRAVLESGHAAVARAERRVATARMALQARRARLGVGDERDHWVGAGDRSVAEGASLAARLARERATLMELRSYLREDNARIAASKARVAALSAEIARPGGPVGGVDVGSGDHDHAALLLELEFAVAAHQSALRGLEALRADAWRQDRHLVVVAQPHSSVVSWTGDRSGGILAGAGALAALAAATVLTVGSWHQLRAAVWGTGSWASASPSG